LRGVEILKSRSILRCAVFGIPSKRKISKNEDATSAKVVSP